MNPLLQYLQTPTVYAKVVDNFKRRCGNTNLNDWSLGRVLNDLPYSPESVALLNPTISPLEKTYVEALRNEKPEAWFYFFFLKTCNDLLDDNNNLQQEIRDFFNKLYIENYSSLECDIHYMSELPPASNTAYRNTYIVLKNGPAEEANLFYIGSNGKSEKVKIDNVETFKQKLNDVMGRAERKSLTMDQIHQLITSNGGHAPKPIEGDVVAALSEVQDPLRVNGYLLNACLLTVSQEITPIHHLDVHNREMDEAEKVGWLNYGFDASQLSEEDQEVLAKEKSYLTCAQTLSELYVRRIGNEGLSAGDITNIGSKFAGEILKLDESATPELKKAMIEYLEQQYPKIYQQFQRVLDKANSNAKLDPEVLIKINTISEEIFNFNGSSGTSKVVLFEAMQGVLFSLTTRNPSAQLDEVARKLYAGLNDLTPVTDAKKSYYQDEEYKFSLVVLNEAKKDQRLSEKCHSELEAITKPSNLSEWQKKPVVNRVFRSAIQQIQEDKEQTIAWLENILRTMMFSSQPAEDKKIKNDIKEIIIKFRQEPFVANSPEANNFNNIKHKANLILMKEESARVTRESEEKIKAVQEARQAAIERSARESRKTPENAQGGGGIWNWIKKHKTEIAVGAGAFVVGAGAVAAIVFTGGLAAIPIAGGLAAAASGALGTTAASVVTAIGVGAVFSAIAEASIGVGKAIGWGIGKVIDFVRSKKSGHPDDAPGAPSEQTTLASQGSTFNPKLTNGSAERLAYGSHIMQRPASQTVPAPSSSSSSPTPSSSSSPLAPTSTPASTPPASPVVSSQDESVDDSPKKNKGPATR